MSIKLIGAVMIVLSCGLFGFRLAAAYTNELRQLQDFRFSVSYLRNELCFRATPLPVLCAMGAKVSKGCVRSFWERLGVELEAQICPNTRQCVQNALVNIKRVPESLYDSIEMLGKTLGAFDVEGQMSSLDQLCVYLDNKIEDFIAQQDHRVRTYRTVGICAGVAFAIILI